MKLGPYETGRVHQGYVPGVLRDLPAGSVHCCITSPPYWGLRKYQDVEPQEWGDGSSSILGLEESPDRYIEHLVECFREIHRVLRFDGTLWLNMGDSYITSPHGHGDTHDPKWPQGRDRKNETPNRSGNRIGHRSSFRRDRRPREDEPHRSAFGLKPKDLCGMPWRVAFALQADGWYLRQDIVWHKPNPMPESVSDRPTKAHEYVFLLAKSERYFFDAFAIREKASGITHPRGDGVNPKAEKVPTGWDTGPGSHRRLDGRYKTSPSKAACDTSRAFSRRRRTTPIPRQNPSFSAAVVGVLRHRNKRSVWKIPTQPFPGAHFATFPTRLVEPMVLAGTSEHGVCTACGAPWKRIVETVRSDRDDAGRTHSLPDQRMGKTPPPERGWEIWTETVGWEPSCNCGLFSHEPPAPAVVLDPFAGSGTTLAVARRLGRAGIGFDASNYYVEEIVPNRLNEKGS